MKVEKILKAENEFNPITLQITLESKEEAIDFFNIYNHTFIIESTMTKSSKFYSAKELVGEFYDIDEFNNFENRLIEMFKRVYG